MPYNGSGVFTPATPPRQPNTTILSSDYNSDLNDLSNGFSNAVTRDGQGAMSTQFKLVSGTVTVPGLGFSAATSTGIYMPSSNDMAFPVQGGEVMRLTLDGANRNVLIGTTSSTGERLQVTGPTKLDGALSVTGASTFGGATTFNGAITLNGALSANGNITVTKADPFITAKATTGAAVLDLDSATGQQAIVRNKKAGVVRWSAGVGGGTDDWETVRYNASGAVVDVAHRIEASTGRSLFTSVYSTGTIQSAGGVLALSGTFAHASGAQVVAAPDSSGSAVINLRTNGIGASQALIYAINAQNGATSWALALRNGTNSNAFDLLRYNPANGAYLDNPINVNSSSGIVTLNQTIVNSNLTVNANINAGGNLSVGSQTITNGTARLILNRTSTTGAASVYLSSNGTGIWDIRSSENATADFVLNRFDGSIWQQALSVQRSNGALTVNGPATFATTINASSWISSTVGVAGHQLSATGGTVYLATPSTSSPNQLAGLVNGVPRWAVELPSTAGHFAINRYDPSTGGWLETPMWIDQSTGTATFSKTIAANISGTSANSNSVNWANVVSRPTVEATSGGGVGRWTNINGTIYQTTTISVTITPGESSYNVFFPRGFPNMCTGVWLQLESSSGFAVFRVTNKQPGYASFTATDVKTAITGAQLVNVLAVGY